MIDSITEGHHSLLMQIIPLHETTQNKTFPIGLRKFRYDRGKFESAPVLTVISVQVCWLGRVAKLSG